METKIGALSAFVLFAATSVPLSWADIIAKLGIGGLFAWYLFVHAPRQEALAHQRRMEELRFLAEVLRKDG